MQAQPPTYAEAPLPGAVWAIIGTMTLLALVGAGLWVAWAVGLPADEGAAQLWRFLCQ